MPRCFFDSSALIKYYHNEIGSPRVLRILGEAGSEHLIARFTLVELLSGLAKKVRMGVIAAQDYGKLDRRFRADVNQRLLRPIRMLNAHFEAAGDLIDKHGRSRRLRALDAIQLAVALHLHQSTPVDHFVCADQDLCTVASLEGLAVINPQHP
ncbi:MAG: type II toxin-antitoxin system VapC family toxin [Isosphaerales bacterium]